MLFNSINFFIFFIITYLLYLGLHCKWQNRLLLIASYFFYAYWDWRFLSLVFISTIINYYFGLKISASAVQRIRKRYLIISIVLNLGILFIFKYLNFFYSSAVDLLTSCGLTSHTTDLMIILPIGLSFYTFQSMSYTIDIYWRRMEPEKDFIDFALFVSFFPQLLSGPIERAKNFLPQITHSRRITRENFGQGCYLICWGLFQKIFIADNLAIVCASVFDSQASFSSLNILIGCYAFVIQLYSDFAGYSNMACGLAKLMGFELTINFNLPLFSKNPSDFWRRWHISLTSWFRDYVFIPLWNKRAGRPAIFRALFITMLLCGLWHGASWGWIIWGIYNGLLIVGYHLIKPWWVSSSPMGKLPASLRKISSMVVMFHLFCISAIFARTRSLEQARGFLIGLFSNFSLNTDSLHIGLSLIYFSFFLIIFETIQYKKNDIMVFMKWSLNTRVIFLAVAFSLVLYVMILGKEALIGGGSEFIYFKF